jgi:hypothetical protein
MALTWAAPFIIGYIVNKIEEKANKKKTKVPVYRITTESQWLFILESTDHLEYKIPFWNKKYHFGLSFEFLIQINNL